MPANIFVRDLTILDCAVAMGSGGAQGASWHVDVEWHGKRDAHGMVLDFGEAKRLAKDCLDTHFDHRLLLPSSQFRAHPFAQSHRMAVFSLGCSKGQDAALLAPVSHFAELKMGTNESGLGISQEGLLQGLAQEFAKKIKNSSPQPQIDSVSVVVREEILTPDVAAYSYTHSLQFHSGNCQRFHGHRNRVEVLNASGGRNRILEKTLAAECHGLYFIGASYLKAPRSCSEFVFLQRALESSAEEEMAWVSYEGSQGPVWLVLPRSQVEVMSSESTVENIAEHLTGKYAHGDHRGSRVRAFEGIAKGSLAP